MCSTVHWGWWAIAGVIAGFIFGVLVTRHFGVKAFLAIALMLAIVTLVLYFKVRGNGCFT